MTRKQKPVKYVVLTVHDKMPHSLFDPRNRPDDPDGRRGPWVNAEAKYYHFDDGPKVRAFVEMQCKAINDKGFKASVTTEER